MEKKDFEKTSTKVAEMNKHFRNECYNSPYKVYKEDKYYKEKNIKEVADYYKDEIPQKLYNSMYSYEVEITD